jgi:hypothetical protein
MARIVENQIQIAKPMPLLAFKETEAQQGWSAGGDLHGGCNALGIGYCDLQNSSRCGDLAGELIDIVIGGEKQQQE